MPYPQIEALTSNTILTDGTETNIINLSDPKVKQFHYYAFLGAYNNPVDDLTIRTYVTSQDDLSEELINTKTYLGTDLITVLEGFVTGKKCRVTAQLNAGATGRTIKGDVYQF